MTLEDCPHCLALVVPMHGRVCPACNQAFGPPSDLVSLDVADGERLPGFCVTCRTPTERVEVIDRKRVPEAEYPWWMALFNLRLLVLVSKDRERMHADTKTVRVEVPHCEACAVKAPVDVRYVDFERGRLTVVAHRELRELQKMGRKAGGAAHAR